MGDNPELIVLRGDVDALRRQVEELTAEQRRQAMNNFRPEPQFDRLKPDLPGFFLRRYGVGGFDKVIMSAGYALNARGTSATSVPERTFTLIADRYFYAQWDGQEREWVLASAQIVHDGASFPASDTRYTILPIAKATWSSANNAVDVITMYHTGLLCPPIEVSKGIICMWSGTTPPDGWYLCDGTNGTPDLRGRFVVGYKSDHVAPSTLPNENGNYTQPGNLSTGGATAGNTGGQALHGYTENNHNDHVFKLDAEHVHSLPFDAVNSIEICAADKEGDPASCPVGSSPITVPYFTASSMGSTGSTSGWGGDDNDPNTPDDDTGVTSVGDADEGTATGGPLFEITLKHTGRSGNEDTDNRPPYYVLAFIMKA